MCNTGGNKVEEKDERGGGRGEVKKKSRKEGKKRNRREEKGRERKEMGKRKEGKDKEMRRERKWESDTVSV